ncbi:MAG TPA: ABC transporter permease [Vicinamibacterales bacterium]|nr:ABC transporter permease [Vicinamibacterales bacterium]
MKTIGEWVFAALLLAYPREFRAQYRDDLVAFFREDRERPRTPAGLSGSVRFWWRTVRDLMVASSRLRRERRATGQAGARVGGFSRQLVDLRDAWRSLAGTPGTTAVALAVLTIGLGASTTIFAVADAIALRPLPYADPDRLVVVSETDLKTGRPVPAAAPNYLEWLTRQDVFSAVGASSSVSLVYRDGERSERFLSIRTTASLFPMLGATPQLGRLFDAGNEAPGSEEVVLVSDAFWRTRLAGNPNVIGTLLAFEDGPRRIVGVMPRGFKYPIAGGLLADVRFWVPMKFGAADRARDGGRTYALTVVARLEPDVAIDQARSQMTAIRDALASEYPKWFFDHGVTVRAMRDAVISASVRSWTMLLLGAVGLLLLIACVNVANLLLARASGRSREFGIRAALGATRIDLIRAVAIESLLLAIAGVAAGWFVASLGVAVLSATLPEAVPRVAPIGLDGRVFLAAALVGVATAVLVGVAPAYALTRPRAAFTLRDAGRATTAGRGQQRLRSTLVVVEVALAIVLLVGTGMFIVSFVRVATRDLGFEPDRVATFSVAPRRGADALGRPPEDTDAEDRATLAAVLARIQSTPGVEAAAFMNGGLPFGSSRSNGVRVAWRDEPFTESDDAYICETTPDYLRVFGLRLRRGRWLQASDRAGSPNVIVLSETAVERYLGGREPIGAEVQIDEKTWTIVGVVADTLFRGPEAERLPQVYIPLPQSSALGTSLAVRLRTNDAVLVETVRNAAWAAAPAAVVSSSRTLNDLLAGLVAQRRFNMLLIGTFGLVALLLVFAGIYGVMTHVVSQRVTEIGVRMALGARPSQMLRMVLARALQLAAIGLAIGWLSAAGLERFVRAFIFQPEPRDPVVYASVAVALLLTAAVAALVPARRAANVDPLTSLRAD